MGWCFVEWDVKVTRLAGPLYVSGGTLPKNWEMVDGAPCDARCAVAAVL